VWCIDIVFDVTSAGTTVSPHHLDEGSHFCISIVVSGPPRRQRRGEGPADAIVARRTLVFLRSDNGGEFISQALKRG